MSLSGSTSDLNLPAPLRVTKPDMKRAGSAVVPGPKKNAGFTLRSLEPVATPMGACERSVLATARRVAGMSSAGVGEHDEGGSLSSRGIIEVLEAVRGRGLLDDKVLLLTQLLDLVRQNPAMCEQFFVPRTHAESNGARAANCAPCAGAHATAWDTAVTILQCTDIADPSTPAVVRGILAILSAVALRAGIGVDHLRGLLGTLIRDGRWAAYSSCLLHALVCMVAGERGQLAGGDCREVQRAEEGSSGEVQGGGRGKVFFFDGLQGGLYMGQFESWPFEQGYAFETWIWNDDSTGGHGRLLFRVLAFDRHHTDGGAAARRTLVEVVLHAQTLIIMTSQSGSSKSPLQCNAKIPSRQWVHIVVSHRKGGLLSRAECDVTVNGQFASYVLPLPKVASQTVSTEVLVGCCQLDPSSEQPHMFWNKAAMTLKPFKGLLRSVRVFSSPLTGADARALFGAPRSDVGVIGLSQQACLVALPHHLFPSHPNPWAVKLGQDAKVRAAFGDNGSRSDSHGGLQSHPSNTCCLLGTATVGGRPDVVASLDCCGGLDLLVSLLAASWSLPAEPQIPSPSAASASPPATDAAVQPPPHYQRGDNAMTQGTTLPDVATPMLELLTAVVAHVVDRSAQHGTRHVVRPQHEHAHSGGRSGGSTSIGKSAGPHLWWCGEDGEKWARPLVASLSYVCLCAPSKKMPGSVVKALHTLVAACNTPGEVSPSALVGLGHVGIDILLGESGEGRGGTGMRRGGGRESAGKDMISDQTSRRAVIMWLLNSELWVGRAFGTVQQAFNLLCALLTRSSSLFFEHHLGPPFGMISSAGKKEEARPKAWIVPALLDFVYDVDVCECAKGQDEFGQRAKEGYARGENGPRSTESRGVVCEFVRQIRQQRGGRWDDAECEMLVDMLLDAFAQACCAADAMHDEPRTLVASSDLEAMGHFVAHCPSAYLRARVLWLALQVCTRDSVRPAGWTNMLLHEMGHGATTLAALANLVHCMAMLPKAHQQHFLQAGGYALLSSQLAVAAASIRAAVDTSASASRAYAHVSLWCERERQGGPSLKVEKLDVDSHDIKCVNLLFDLMFRSHLYVSQAALAPRAVVLYLDSGELLRDVERTNGPAVLVLLDFLATCSGLVRQQCLNDLSLLIDKSEALRGYLVSDAPSWQPRLLRLLLGQTHAVSLTPAAFRSLPSVVSWGGSLVRSLTPEAAGERAQVHTSADGDEGKSGVETGEGGGAALAGLVSKVLTTVAHDMMLVADGWKVFAHCCDALRQAGLLSDPSLTMRSSSKPSVDSHSKGACILRAMVDAACKSAKAALKAADRWDGSVVLKGWRVGHCDGPDLSSAAASLDSAAPSSISMIALRDNIGGMLATVYAAEVQGVAGSASYLHRLHLSTGPAPLPVWLRWGRDWTAAVRTGEAFNKAGGDDTIFDLRSSEALVEVVDLAYGKAGAPLRRANVLAFSTEGDSWSKMLPMGPLSAGSKKQWLSSALWPVALWHVHMGLLRCYLSKFSHSAPSTSTHSANEAGENASYSSLASAYGGKDGVGEGGNWCMVEENRQPLGIEEQRVRSSCERLLLQASCIASAGFGGAGERDAVLDARVSTTVWCLTNWAAVLVQHLEAPIPPPRRRGSAAQDASSAPQARFDAPAGTTDNAASQVVGPSHPADEKMFASCEYAHDAGALGRRERQEQMLQMLLESKDGKDAQVADWSALTASCVPEVLVGTARILMRRHKPCHRVISSLLTPSASTGVMSLGRLSSLLGARLAGNGDGIDGDDRPGNEDDCEASDSTPVSLTRVLIEGETDLRTQLVGEERVRGERMQEWESAQDKQGKALLDDSVLNMLSWQTSESRRRQDATRKKIQRAVLSRKAWRQTLKTACHAESIWRSFLSFETGDWSQPSATPSPSLTARSVFGEDVSVFSGLWRQDGHEAGELRLRRRLKRDGKGSSHLHKSYRHFLEPGLEHSFRTDLVAAREDDHGLGTLDIERLLDEAAGNCHAATDKVEEEYECELVTSSCIVVGCLSVSQVALTFRVKCAKQAPAGNDLNENGPLARLLQQKRQCWPLADVQRLEGRRFLLRATALEISFSDGSSVFFNFPGDTCKMATAPVSQAYRRLSTLIGTLAASRLRVRYLSEPAQALDRYGLTQDWVDRKISNLQYLLALNAFAGRTIHDLTQYPVMPWVLADYVSPALDLSDARVYRDLSKPIGCQKRAQEEQFQHRFRTWADDEIKPFHYGSHYSTAGGVLWYLLRLEPYTSSAIHLQGGHLDCPDRLFRSMAEAYNGCTTSTTDVKELTPEFFYLPEFLLNINGLDLGVTQQGEQVGAVQLPPWAKDARDFVAIHRQALESDLVSASLHLWIDLIFGHKQRGPAAEEATNVYYYLTYEGEVDLDAIHDDVMRQATEAQIVNFGQTPRQLFTQPHPQRRPASAISRALFSDALLPCGIGQHGGEPGQVSLSAPSAMSPMPAPLDSSAPSDTAAMERGLHQERDLHVDALIAETMPEFHDCSSPVSPSEVPATGRSGRRASRPVPLHTVRPIPSPDAGMSPPAIPPRPERPIASQTPSPRNAGSPSPAQSLRHVGHTREPGGMHLADAADSGVASARCVDGATTGHSAVDDARKEPGSEEVSINDGPGVQVVNPGSSTAAFGRVQSNPTPRSKRKALASLVAGAIQVASPAARTRAKLRACVRACVRVCPWRGCAGLAHSLT